MVWHHPTVTLYTGVSWSGKNDLFWCIMCFALNVIFPVVSKTFLISILIKPCIDKDKKIRVKWFQAGSVEWMQINNFFIPALDKRLDYVYLLFALIKFCGSIFLETSHILFVVHPVLQVWLPKCYYWFSIWFVCFPCWFE